MLKPVSPSLFSVAAGASSGLSHTVLSAKLNGVGVKSLLDTGNILLLLLKGL